jgi:hypothetical protein
MIGIVTGGRRPSVEGDGWVNWSDLATLPANFGNLLAPSFESFFSF